MSGKLSCKHTIFACYAGYITQAIVNNLSPLLFVIFRDTFDLPLSEITLLITINFLIQLCVDCLSAVFVDKIGYRKCIVAAHVFAVAGLASLSILPVYYASVCGTSRVGIPLCHRWRTYRGAYQSDSRSLPDRQQSLRHEPASFVLLLGNCRRDSSLDAVSDPRGT